MYGNNIFVFMLCSLLAVCVQCQESEGFNVTSENINNPEGEQKTTFLSPLIRIAGSLLTNTFNNSGVDSRTLNSATNLFSADKVKQNLLLFRRGLTLVARYAVLLNKYLPSPSSNEVPHKILSKKVRFYSTNSDNFQWLDTNNNESSVPPHVESEVNFVAQNEVSSAPTTTSEDAEESIVIITTTTEIEESIEVNSVVNPSSTTTTQPSEIDNAITTKPTNNYPFNLSPTQNISGQFVTNANASNSSPPAFNFNGFYNIPGVLPQLNGTSNFPLNLYNIPTPYLNPYYQGLFGLPPLTEEIAFDLPHYGSYVQFTNRDEPNSALKGRLGSIADIPLEYPTFSDSLNGDLRDSFGLPIKTDFGRKKTPLTKK